MTRNSLNKLPVVEEFYTLQGEGFHTGRAAWFIRLAGCDVGCSWCDTMISWNTEGHVQQDIDEMVARAADSPGSLVVVTGGEPFMHNLDKLCLGLENAGLETAVETSGVYPLSGSWDWICLSPKPHKPPLEEFYRKANELKIIIAKEEDFNFAFENAVRVGTSCKLYLQPEWSVFRTISPLVNDFIKLHPEWRMSLQTHKFLRIP